jgi:hypothetical protein
MRRTTLFLTTAFAVALAGQPFYGLLQQYKQSFEAYSRDVTVVAESVRAHYPRLFFAVPRGADEDTIVAVLAEAEVKSTIDAAGRQIWVRATGDRGTEDFFEFDYLRLFRSMDIAGRLMNASISGTGLLLKTVGTSPEVGDTASFYAAVRDFNYYSMRIIAVAIWLRQRGTGMPPPFDTVTVYSNLKSYQGWYKVTLERKRIELDNALKDFQVRYGSASDKLNVAEVVLVELFPCLRGGENGPSPLEPILRFAPITYNVSDNRVLFAVQGGVSYYFLSGSPWWVSWLNHVGIAAVAGDLQSTRLFDIDVKNLSWGMMAHAGRYELGLMRDSETKGWKFISTVNFQMIPLGL